ncbi:MAG: hypothetical protein WCI27_11555 [Candidatus Omnitrophota bacterium]
MLTINVDAWIIQDGNYDDFEAGKNYKFALEFYPLKVSKTTCREKTLVHLGHSYYKLNAHVVFVSSRCWIIDFGLLAYDKIDAKLDVRGGEYVEIEGYLGLDPFFYFEDLKNEENIPPMIYEWAVKKICLDVTPWIENADGEGSKIPVRDKERMAYKEIFKTDVWEDDDGNASYLFEVERSGSEPSYQR